MTPKQKALLTYITDFMKANDGVSPSFAEMQLAMGFSSKSGIFRILAALEADGHIRRKKKRWRNIELTPDKQQGLGHLDSLSNQEIARELDKRGLILCRILNFPDGKGGFMQKAAKIDF